MRSRNDRRLVNGVEECLDPILEVFFDPIPNARKQNKVLLSLARAQRRLKDEAIIDSPLFGELLFVVAFRLDRVPFFDLRHISCERAAIQLSHVILDRKAVKICAMASKPVVVQLAAFSVVNDLWRGHVQIGQFSRAKVRERVEQILVQVGNNFLLSDPAHVIDPSEFVPIDGQFVRSQYFSALSLDGASFDLARDRKTVLTRNEMSKCSV